MKKTASAEPFIGPAAEMTAHDTEVCTQQLDACYNGVSHY
jgi:hypothetical protein